MFSRNYSTKIVDIYEHDVRKFHKKVQKTINYCTKATFFRFTVLYFPKGCTERLSKLTIFQSQPRPHSPRGHSPFAGNVATTTPSNRAILTPKRNKTVTKRRLPWLLTIINLKWF